MSKISVDAITDEAGTGKPDFSNGLTSSGNVGIGTTPESWNSVFNGVLQVGTNAVVVSTAGSAQIGSNFYYDGAYKRIRSDFSSRMYQANGAYVFETAATGAADSAITFSESMRIDASGSFQLSPASNQGTFRFGNQQGNGSGIGAQFYLDNSQSIWYNSTTSTGDKYHAQFINGNGLVGHIKTNGSATAYNTSSDYRLKTDAQPMAGASARVQELNPVNFEWLSDGTRVDGFLAHEAQAVVPEAVTGTQDAMKDEEYEVTPAVLDDEGNVTTEAEMGTRSVPDYQGIDQSKLVPLLTAALQEALAKIESMETRLTALEG